MRHWKEPREMPEPYAQCWECNEAIHLDEDNDIQHFEIDGEEYYCCMRASCIKNIMYEVGMTDLSIDEFEGKYLKESHELTDKEAKALRINEKVDQKLLEKRLGEKGGKK